MYYIPEVFKRQSGAQLSQCWLAATLSEAQFKKICKTPKLISINIEKLCDEIIRGTKTYEYSLYLSSQFMIGVSKLQLYKTKALEASCKQLQDDLLPQFLPKKKKHQRKSREKNNPFELLDLTAEIPEPPPFPKQFLIDLQQADRHLIIEVDESLGRMGYAHGFQDEVDNFGERAFDRLNADSLTALSRGDGLFAKWDDSNIDPKDSTVHEEIPEQYPIMLSALNSNQAILRTPTKRARGTHADTPSKRRRTTLFKSLENQENIPPTDEPMSISPHRSPIIINPPIMREEYRPPPTVDDNSNEVQSAQDDIPLGLILEPLCLDETLPRQRMKHTKFLDELKYISHDDLKKQIENPYVMTRKDKSLVNINRIRLDSQSLFNRPSTSCRFKSDLKWSNELQERFFNHIEGPFHVDNDESLFAESVRVRNTTEVTAELSDDIDQRKLLIPEHQDIETTDTASHVLGDEISLAEIPHEPVDFENAEIPDQSYIESGSATISKGQSHITLSAVAPIEKPDQFLTSHDLPRPNDMEKEVVPGQSRSSSGDKTVDINNIPSSSSSESNSSTSSAASTKKKLIDELKRRWDEKLQQYPVEFAEVFPPDTTLKFTAACGSLDLMCLATDGEVSIQQEESNAPIYIYLEFD